MKLEQADFAQYFFGRIRPQRLYMGTYHKKHKYICYIRLFSIVTCMYIYKYIIIIYNFIFIVRYRVKLYILYVTVRITKKHNIYVIHVYTVLLHTCIYINI